MDDTLTLYIFKLVILFNAYSMGWEIRKINDKSYELRKKISKQKDFNLEKFINKIIKHPMNINDIIQNNT